MDVLAVGCGVALVVVFGAAVVGKARDLPAFARSLEGSRLVGRRWRAWVAGGVVVVESAVVVLLVAPGTTWYGFALATAVSAILTGAVALTVARRTPAPCLCFGGPPRDLEPVHLVRNAMLTGVSVLGLATGGPLAPPEMEQSVVAGLAGAVAALLFIKIDDLRSVFR
ncbi:MauE/DoxX family redox-associated membrane protein [Actinomadura sp. ATCC 39365]